jgi:hypothetical protein
MIDIPIWLVEALLCMAVGFIIIVAIVKFVKCCSGDDNAD